MEEPAVMTLDIMITGQVLVKLYMGGIRREAISAAGARGPLGPPRPKSGGVLLK
jgi:hypothetical protein